MDKFADIEAFTAVVEAGTFSAAGERLGIAKSVVSRRVSQLEGRLGSRLLHRTTRRLALTDAGKNFYQRAVQVLADLDDAEQDVTEQATELRGPLKLAAPLSFGLLHLSAAIVDFLGEHPAIELNIDLNDRNINLVEEGFDMAVRIGELQDSTLVARRIGTMRSVTCASPAYLERVASTYWPAIQQYQLQAAVALPDPGGQDDLCPATDPDPRQQWRGTGGSRHRRPGHHASPHLYRRSAPQGGQPGEHPE